MHCALSNESKMNSYVAPMPPEMPKTQNGRFPFVEGVTFYVFLVTALEYVH